MKRFKTRINIEDKSFGGTVAPGLFPVPPLCSLCLRGYLKERIN
jgi:hypothetical protein